MDHTHTSLQKHAKVIQTLTEIFGEVDVAECDTRYEHGEFQRGVEVATGTTGNMGFLLAGGREVATSLAFDLLRPCGLSEFTFSVNSITV